MRKKLLPPTMQERGISSGKPTRVKLSNCETCAFLISVLIATCGGGGISPTFGAALWIVDYALQGVLNGVERQYFHLGTIGNCVSYARTS